MTSRSRKKAGAIGARSPTSFRSPSLVRSRSWETSAVIQRAPRQDESACESRNVSSVVWSRTLAHYGVGQAIPRRPCEATQLTVHGIGASSGICQKL